MHCALTVFAALCAMGAFPALIVKPEEWMYMRYLHFNFLFCLGGIYLVRSYFEDKIATLQAIFDWLFGVAAFEVLQSLLGRVHLGGPLSHWLALAASFFQIFYGATLLRGRQIWSRLELL